MNVNNTVLHKEMYVGAYYHYTMVLQILLMKLGMLLWNSEKLMSYM